MAEFPRWLTPDKFERILRDGPNVADLLAAEQELGRPPTMHDARHWMVLVEMESARLRTESVDL